MRCHSVVLLSLAVFPALLFAAPGAEEPAIRSHPPLQPAPPASDRPLAKGPAYYVDPRHGDDDAKGSKGAPLRTIAAALAILQPGDTLYLRGGVYYENVYVALVGTQDAPITIRSYPGEQATIDGSFREFFTAPARAWEPFPGGSPGEYRSRQRYANLRNIHGRFGDSMVGLQVYYHIEDLRGQRYVGPGIWYDPFAHRIPPPSIATASTPVHC